MDDMRIGQLIVESGLRIDQVIGGSLLEIGRIESQSMNSFECLRANVYKKQDRFIIWLIIKHALPKSSNLSLMDTSTTLTVVPFTNLGDNADPCWSPLALHVDKTLQEVKPVTMIPNQNTIFGTLNFEIARGDWKYKDLEDAFDRKDFQDVPLYFTVQKRLPA